MSRIRKALGLAISGSGLVVLLSQVAMGYAG